MKAIQISLVLIAVAWVALLAERGLNKALETKADELREQGEPEIVTRAKTCSATGSNRNACSSVQLGAFSELSNYNILNGFGFAGNERPVESNGGQQMVPTGGVDMDLYRY